MKKKRELADRGAWASLLSVLALCTMMSCFKFLPPQPPTVVDCHLELRTKGIFFLLKLLHFITILGTKLRHHTAITALLYPHILFYRLVWELARLAARWGYWWLSPSRSGCLEMANTIKASQWGRNSQPRILCTKCGISPVRASYHLVLGVNQEQWQCLVLF